MVTKRRNLSKETPAKKNPAKQTQAATPAKTAKSNGAGSSSVTPASALPASPSPSSQETLRRLYTSLLRCRMVQEQAHEMSMDNYQLAIGQEAIVTAPTAELTAEDTVTAAPGNLAALVARGLPPGVLLSEPLGDGVSRSSVTPASVPDDPFNRGTGIALAHRLAKKQRVVVAFCPQESPALENWHEALKFAGVHKLPILYVITNGVADQQSPSEHAPHLEAFSFMTRDYGYPGIIVDGQDVVAVWRAAQESIHRARQGSGPTLLDCRTDSGRDPLAYMEHYMRKRKVWEDGWKQDTERAIRSEIEKATAHMFATR